MNTMTGKEVLRAIADGADPGEFEVGTTNQVFYDFKPAMWTIVDLANATAQFRRKPRTRVVNGFTVPAPIDYLPIDEEPVFAANMFAPEWFGEINYSGFSWHTAAFDRGLLFSTKEAAIANAKAMVGIDPNGEA